ncbi:bifunctional phosphoribosyl-AMP cyclohydrolase /phosphoribosyl-ATP pyrophosphatase protein [Aggregatibacter actinomycetemcomitans]|nr:bifunctional phosphoribosyl-AMP cyclohydrolase /phosphoribosyl-ATP pyrophosphatase protein [Aggregatibacter actinomycetemcomitans]
MKNLSEEESDILFMGAKQTSGNFLNVVDMSPDCDDQDTLLILASPVVPTCHTGTESCFRHLPHEPN